MKVILDANVLISFLLSPHAEGKVAQVVETCLSAAIDLIVPGELIDEFEASVQRSRYLQERIPHWKLATLVETLRMDVVHLQRVDSSQIVRDPRDDYLIRYGIAYAVDFLITGDKDLLVLGRVQNVRILTPAQFLDLYP